MALLTVGSLSDYIGRRPAILAALVLNVVSMVMFMMAGSGAALVAARALQGFATGLATATLGAAILDNDRNRGPVLNSITAFGGLTVGSIGAAILVTYAPDPRELVYVVLLALSAIEGFVSLVHARNCATARRRACFLAAPCWRAGTGPRRVGHPFHPRDHRILGAWLGSTSH